MVIKAIIFLIGLIGLICIPWITIPLIVIYMCFEGITSCFTFAGNINLDVELRKLNEKKIMDSFLYEVSCLKENSVDGLIDRKSISKYLIPYTEILGRQKASALSLRLVLVSIFGPVIIAFCVVYGFNVSLDDSYAALLSVSLVIATFVLLYISNMCYKRACKVYALKYDELLSKEHNILALKKSQ